MYVPVVQTRERQGQGKIRHSIQEGTKSKFVQFGGGLQDQGKQYLVPGNKASFHKSTMAMNIAPTFAPAHQPKFKPLQFRLRLMKFFHR